MNVFSRYLIRHLFLGFAAAAGLLLPLFTTFNLINELDDVSPGGYRWTQAVLVVLMTLPRTLVELSPFIALLGGIVGLGQLSKNSELTAIRSTGFSIFRIALVALVAGILWTVSLGAIDEWVASPLQQQALQIPAQACRYEFFFDQVHGGNNAHSECPCHQRAHQCKSDDDPLGKTLPKLHHEPRRGDSPRHVRCATEACRTACR